MFLRKGFHWFWGDSRLLAVCWREGSNSAQGTWREGSRCTYCGSFCRKHCFRHGIISLSTYQLWFDHVVLDARFDLEEEVDLSWKYHLICSSLIEFSLSNSLSKIFKILNFKFFIDFKDFKLFFIKTLTVME